MPIARGASCAAIADGNDGGAETAYVAQRHCIRKRSSFKT